MKNKKNVNEKLVWSDDKLPITDSKKFFMFDLEDLNAIIYVEPVLINGTWFVRPLEDVNDFKSCQLYKVCNRWSMSSEFEKYLEATGCARKESEPVRNVRKESEHIEKDYDDEDNHLVNMIGFGVGAIASGFVAIAGAGVMFECIKDAAKEFRKIKEDKDLDN